MLVKSVQRIRMNIIDEEKTEQARYLKHIVRTYSKQHLAYTHTCTCVYASPPHMFASEPVCNVLRERDDFTQETLKIRAHKQVGACRSELMRSRPQTQLSVQNIMQQNKGWDTCFFIPREVANHVFS